MILITYGTRPEYIKVKPLIKVLTGSNIKFKTLFTGQHKDLVDNIADYNFNMVDVSKNRLDNIINNCTNLPDEYFSDVNYVLIQGDTSSALGLALTAFNRKIKIIHLEAGLRTYNYSNPYPEEMNRQLISRISDINLCPTIENYNNLINELNSELKSELEIIYKDKNLICLIPKTQRISSILGNKTNWCQREKGGFNIWSNVGLLFRFLFKNGRKIRMTYAFENNEAYNHDANYHWANEEGYHILKGFGNPFKPQTTEKIRNMEQDVLNLISQIPDECKNEVLKTIEFNKRKFNYCYSDYDYITNKETKNKSILRKINTKYEKEFDEIYNQRNFYLATFLDENLNFVIKYAPSENDPTEEFIIKSPVKYEEKLIELFKFHGLL